MEIVRILLKWAWEGARAGIPVIVSAGVLLWLRVQGDGLFGLMVGVIFTALVSLSIAQWINHRQSARRERRPPDPS